MICRHSCHSLPALANAHSLCPHNILISTSCRVCEHGQREGVEVFGQLALPPLLACCRPKQVPPPNNVPAAGFVNVDSEKMSKSLGNFFTIRDVAQRYHPAALRWFLVNTQYRQPINYTQRALEEVGTLRWASCAVHALHGPALRVHQLCAAGAGGEGHMLCMLCVQIESGLYMENAAGLYLLGQPPPGGGHRPLQS